MMQNDTDSENINNPTGGAGYHSDMMRSLQRLAGNSQVTIKTNKFDDPTVEGGKGTIINVD
jgi:hypothetical protein